MWTTRPLLQIKKLDNGKYTWNLYLSNNKRRPSCISPTQYDDAFKCRDRAKKFAAKFKGPLRLLDKENKIDEIIIVDETRNETMPDYMVEE
jgi:hypothetical protein